MIYGEIESVLVLYADSMPYFVMEKLEKSVTERKDNRGPGGISTDRKSEVVGWLVGCIWV